MTFVDMQSYAARCLSAIQSEFTLCRTKCGACFFQCTQSQTHDGEHDCGTSHGCPGDCTFCLGSTSSQHGETSCTALLSLLALKQSIRPPKCRMEADI